jgi:hypothetical protein
MTAKTVLPNSYDTETPPSTSIMENRDASSAGELGVFLEELRKLQNQMRQNAAQIMEGGADTAIWETRGGLRMLTMITQQVEARVKQLATE